MSDEHEDYHEHRPRVKVVLPATLAGLVIAVSLALGTMNSQPTPTPEQQETEQHVPDEEPMGTNSFKVSLGEEVKLNHGSYLVTPFHTSEKERVAYTIKATGNEGNSGDTWVWLTAYTKEGHKLDGYISNDPNVTPFPKNVPPGMTVRGESVFQFTGVDPHEITVFVHEVGA